MEPTLSPAWLPIERSIRNRRTGQSYRMVSADKVAVTEDQVTNIVTICNQQTIYFLFKNKLGGKAYSGEQAQDFLRWAHRGWREQTHFVFLLTDASNMVVGALDIKSSDRFMPEIGYWCDERHRGLMSNALAQLIDLAREAGFSGLCARVLKDNAPSQTVLERNKFERRGDWSNDPSRARYELRLGKTS